jgi:hypothetical protein
MLDLLIIITIVCLIYKLYDEFTYVSMSMLSNIVAGLVKKDRSREASNYLESMIYSTYHKASRF